MIDSDGAELLLQLGGDSPPVYPGTTEPVITPRLRTHLSPVERAWWSGVDLEKKLAQRAFWLTGGEPVDGWGIDDLIQWTLLRGHQKGSGHYVTLRNWLTGKVVNLRRDAAKKFEEVPLYLEDEDGEEYLVIDPEDPDFVPTILPDAVLTWLENRVSPKMYVALRLIAEEGYTQHEAAREVGLGQSTISEALKGLRSSLEEK